jgi:ssDNA-binding replication factor A large subunit
MFQPLEFEREGKKSSVANVILSDGSGMIRLSLWDDQIKLLDKLKPGLVVDIYGAYTKDDGRGGVEVRLSKRGGFKESTMELPVLDKTERIFDRCNIADLKENGNYEIRAMVAQLFESGAFYEVCPECGSRIKRTKNGFECQKHAVVQPSFSIVISGVIDDGTGNIRTVLFREAALKLIGMDLNKALDHMDDLFQNIDVLGKEFIFIGRVRKNQMFNRTEFVISDLKNVDVKSEISNQILALTKA